MIVSKPSDLLQMSEGVVPEAITGVLTNLQANPVSGGEGDKQYKFQNATLTQDGSSIRIVFSNRDDVPQELVGQQIVAKTRKNDKGLFGLKRKKGREYQGETPPEIWVYAGAELSSSGGEVSTDDDVQRLEEGGVAKVVAQSNGADPVAKVKKKFVQMGNTMSLCYDTALWVAKTQEEKNDFVMTEAQVQAIASSFFIKSDRNGIVDTMPQTPID
jgi:hypothetical protein